jgi:hypothetical protein
MFEIELDTAVERLDAKSMKVSWTQLSSFLKCPASYFAKALYVSQKERKVCAQVLRTQEDSDAIGGYVLQLLFEKYVNCRVYSREGLRGSENFDARVLWLQKQFRLLVSLVWTDVDRQKEIVRTDVFFATKEGVSRLSCAKADGLDVVYENSLQPKFISTQVFNSKYGSPGEFYTRHNAMIASVLEELDIGKGVDLDLMLSEVWVSAKHLSGEIRGCVDFVYNTRQDKKDGGVLKDMSALQDGYILLDGKIRMNEYVDKGQLLFYIYLLYKKYRKIPSYFGFLEWGTAKFHLYEMRMPAVLSIQSDIEMFLKSNAGVYDQLLRVQEAGGGLSFSELDVDYRPTKGSCKYCMFNTLCPAKNKKV